MISRLPRVPLRRWAARIIGPAKGRVLRGAIAMSVTAALAGGLGFAWHAMSRSPTFAIDDIQVTGLTRSTGVVNETSVDPRDLRQRNLPTRAGPTRLTHSVARMPRQEKGTRRAATRLAEDLSKVFLVASV